MINMNPDIISMGIMQHQDPQLVVPHTDVSCIWFTAYRIQWLPYAVHYSDVWMCVLLLHVRVKEKVRNGGVVVS